MAPVVFQHMGAQGCHVTTKWEALNAWRLGGSKCVAPVVFPRMGAQGRHVMTKWEALDAWRQWYSSTWGPRGAML